MQQSRYLVRLKNEHSFDPADGRALASRIRGEIGGLGARLGTLRVAKAAVEFDLFVEDERALRAAVDRLREPIGIAIQWSMVDLPHSARRREDLMREAIRLFNEERFWECHNALEELWLMAGGKRGGTDEAKMLQGMIQIAAAFIHHQKDEEAVGLSLMEKASEKLGRWPGGEYLAVDLETLRADVATLLKARELKSFKMLSK